MEPKFTKGPYEKDKYGQLRNPEGKPVMTWDAGIGMAYRDEETEANGFLFKAAPDMYAALEEIVEPWEGFLDVEVYEKTSHVKAGQIIRARQALSRARGETK